MFVGYNIASGEFAKQFRQINEITSYCLVHYTFTQVTWYQSSNFAWMWIGETKSEKPRGEASMGVATNLHRLPSLDNKLLEKIA